MEAFKSIGSYSSNSRSSLHEIFNAVKEVFIPQRLKRGYVDKKFEESAL